MTAQASLAGGRVSDPPWEPLVLEMRPAPSPEEAFLRWAGLPHCVFLDSAGREDRRGRYSFLAADPLVFLSLPNHGQNALSTWKTLFRQFSALSIPDLPPFQGGWAGLLSYDLSRQLERHPCPLFDEFAAPALAVGLYDVVLAFDHIQDRAWLISQGWQTGPIPSSIAQKKDRAFRRLQFFSRVLQGEGPTPRLSVARGVAASQSALREAAASNLGGGRVPPGALAPQFVTGRRQGLTSTFSASAYQQAVAAAVEYIHAGDLFQVNLSQRLLLPESAEPEQLYLRLRRCNPAPFAGYLDVGPLAILSASPERFLQVCNRRVETRPIKGTRSRTGRVEADLFSGDELRASDKDRSENIMIVDLLRNDLSRVCLPESVRVTQLCQLETYPYVQHLVSAVEGHLRSEVDLLDLLEATFPGGSITGAPKPRALEVIAELEPTARGAYCGSLGYFGADGSMDSNILIRTITAGRGWWQAPVGGGIVADSHPRHEYEETWHKAEGLLRAFDLTVRVPAKAE